MSSKRSPNASSHASSKQPTASKKVPAELLTYRLEGEMVYVEPARDYGQALEHAQSVFPQLSSVPSSRITFRVNVRVNGSPRTVRIAPMAWSRVLQSLATYEIIDISVLPASTSASSPTTSRAAKSETNLATYNNSGASKTLDDSDAPPPMYGSANMLGGDLFSPALPCNAPRYLEKSPFFTLDAPESPPSPVVKRCTSALSWFNKLL